MACGGRRGSGPQYRRAEPAAGLQREFHAVAVIAHRTPEALLSLTDPLVPAVWVSSAGPAASPAQHTRPTWYWRSRQPQGGLGGTHVDPLARQQVADRRLADRAIGKLGAVKLNDLTARQARKALAGLSTSLPARSLRPPLLSTRLTRSLAHGEQLHWQPVVDRRGRGLDHARALPAAVLSANLNDSVRSGPGRAIGPSRSPGRSTRKERHPCLTSEQATLAAEEARSLTSPGPSRFHSPCPNADCRRRAEQIFCAYSLQHSCHQPGARNRQGGCG